MANYQWTGNAQTGNFFTPDNWNTGGGPANVPPGPSDFVTIDNAAFPIGGTGTAQVLFFQGTDQVKGHLVATEGIPINAQLTLLPGAILTTPRIHFPVALPPNTPIPPGALTVGKDSCVVISGPHTLNDYAIMLAVEFGSTATLLVDGANAVINSRNLPMSVGQAGNGQLTIQNGAVVAVGNDDPLIYPWALVIGNHVSSSGPQFGTGQVTVLDALLVARGQIIVGRSGTGTLEVNTGASVIAEDMFIGWAPPSKTRPQGGQGSVSVNGNNARLVVANELVVQAFGTGSLTVSNKGSVSAGAGIAVNGTLSLSDGQIETTAMSVGGTMTGHGTVTAVEGFEISGTITVDQSLTLIGDIDNSGAITVAAGGHLSCLGTLIADTGTVELQANSVVAVEAVQTGLTIMFSGPSARLELRSPGAFSGTIDGFTTTNTIELDAAATNLTFANSVLAVTGPYGTVAQLQMKNSGPGPFKLLPNPPPGRSVIGI